MDSSQSAIIETDPSRKALSRQDMRINCKSSARAVFRNSWLTLIISYLLRMARIG